MWGKRSAGKDGPPTYDPFRLAPRSRVTGVDPTSINRGRRALALTLLAVAWGVALIVLAVVLPVYSASETTSSGQTSAAASQTLVQVNGVGVLAPVALPALFAALVWFALHRKCSRGGRGAEYLAWTVIGLLFALSMLAAASIGMFVVPMALLLACAAMLTPAGGDAGTAVPGGRAA